MAAAVSPTMLAVLTIGVGALILGIMIGEYTKLQINSIFFSRVEQLVSEEMNL